MAFAAMLLGLRKRLERKFKEAGAVSEETAVELRELNLDKMEQNTLQRLLNRTIKQTIEGRYYWPCKDKKHC